MSALGLLVAVAVSQSSAADVPSGDASLPLRELLPLLAKSPAAPAPRAAVLRARLGGQPAEAGVWVSGHFELDVDVERGVVVVPLLDLGARAVLAPSEATSVPLRQDGPWLSAVVPAGRHTVDFRALVPGRSVRLATAPGVPPVPLVLDVDDDAFAVDGATVVREWGGPAVLPDRGTYTVAYRALRATGAPALASRPPVEPTVLAATARWVSTLEGQARHEVALTLAVDRPTPLTVDVPKHQRLVRARLNGAWVALPKDGEPLTLTVTPSSLGAAQATLELALTQDFGVLHLSGALELEEPGLSWPTKAWKVEATLPQVFRYTRTGGSLSEAAEPTRASGEVPGTLLSFAQHLVGAQRPAVALRYAVELDGQYFR